VYIFDISRPLDSTLAPWPGDRPFRFELTAKQSEGSSVNVGAISSSVHSGTHVDAPFHYRNDGLRTDSLDLSTYLGPALVVDARGWEQIPWEVLAGHDLTRTPRVLFRTDGWLNSARFPEQIPVLAPGVATLLGEGGIVLVGVDLPSVDQIDSKHLPNHHALDTAGIRILEGLDLADVPPGAYELIALPLKLVGADGAPVRAVLRSP
jgi:arylformamidase